VVDCRATAGLGIGGGLAQRNTIAECGERDIIAIAMGPGRRHITKPICEITYALREEGMGVGVIVLNAGNGVPIDAPVRTLATFGLEFEEMERISRYRLAVIHLGNVRNHIIYKTRLILRNVDIRAIVVSQCPVDFKDFASIGVKTREVMPIKNVGTKGEVVDIVTGVIRGVSCPQSKLDEITIKVRRNLLKLSKEQHKLENVKYNLG